IDFATVPIMLTLRQPLPWPGTLGARRRLSEREAATARDEVSETERRLEAEAKRALYDYELAERSLAINQRVRTLLATMVQASSTKYKVGRATRAALLKSQTELLTVDNHRVDIERNRDAARARLNALLDRPVAATLPPPALPTVAPTLPNEEE